MPNIMQDKKKFYIDFNLEGILRVSEDEKDKVLKELQKLFSNVLKNNKSVRINSNISIISEDEIIFPLNFTDPNDFQ